VVATAASASSPAITAPTKPTDAKTKDAKAAPSKAKPAPEKTTASPKAAAQQQARFYVNVGLFADSNNALNAYVKLTDAGLPALKQEFNTSKGKRTRVRVGPYDTEAQTQTAIEKVRALGLEAIILRPEKPPEKP
jgi:cell division septation protein DedD